MRCRHVLSFFFASVLGLEALDAQSERRTAFPQDLPANSTGQGIPFGSHPDFAAGRVQLLVPDAYLPAAGATLLALEFHDLASSTSVTYPILEIRVSAVPQGASRSAIFDQNLPSPTLVFQETDHTVPWNRGGWISFPARQPYVHDGISDLTIDIQKLAQPGIWSGFCTGLHRPDLPTMLKASGNASSGRHRAAVATLQVIPIDVRLVWSSTSTLRLASPRPAIGSHGFSLGSSAELRLDGEPFSLSFGLASSARLPTPIAIPGFDGLLRVAEFPFGLPMLDASGSAVVSFAIPRDRALVGGTFAFQAVVLDAARGRFVFTNTSDGRIEG
ncbi:MAG: hypothetical protein JNM84_25150 [Planctomycetes bacterium]|nr:hypothetical protein [Planctomycetota bacterium]